MKRIVDETHPYPEEYYEQKKQKYVTRFDYMCFSNRWKIYSHLGRWPRLDGDIVFIGIRRWYCGPNEFAIKFCLIGFEMHVWFKIEKR